MFSSCYCNGVYNILIYSTVVNPMEKSSVIGLTNWLNKGNLSQCVKRKIYWSEKQQEINFVSYNLPQNSNNDRSVAQTFKCHKYAKDWVTCVHTWRTIMRIVHDSCYNIVMGLQRMSLSILKWSNIGHIFVHIMHVKKMQNEKHTDRHNDKPTMAYKYTACRETSSPSI